MRTAAINACTLVKAVNDVRERVGSKAWTALAGKGPTCAAFETRMSLTSPCHNVSIGMLTFVVQNDKPMERAPLIITA